MHTDVVECICFYICNATTLTCHKTGICYSIHSFIQTLLALDCDIVIVAHNGNNYDHLFILDYLGATIKFTNLTLCHVSLGTHRLYFRDSFKYCTMSLKQIGIELVNCHKLDIDLHFTDPALRDQYCMRDVEIVYKLLRWLQINMINKFGLSMRLLDFASQADIAYTYVCNSISHFTLTFVDDLHMILKQCYYGGRVYSSIYGRYIWGSLCCIDVRSMYPASLCRPYPCGEITHVTKHVPNKLGIYFIIARRAPPSCIAKTKAIVPVHYKGSLIFVSEGEIEGWYCTPDIDCMIQSGWDVLYRDGFVWADTSVELREVYTSLYNERIKHSKGTAPNYTLKILLNSSYGKFCQKYGRISSRPHYIGWFCLAYTRLQLLHLMSLSKSHPVYYGDTDSIYLSSSILPIPETMAVNQLSVTSNTITVDVESYPISITVLARKVYVVETLDGGQINTVVKCKGGRAVTASTLWRALRVPQRSPLLMKGSRFIKQQDGQYMVDSHNLHDSTRMIRVVVPDYMYLCCCGYYHSRAIKYY